MSTGRKKSNGNGKKGGGRFGAFWSRMLGKKPKESEREKAPTSSGEAQMTPEQKAKLAAEITANALGPLDNKSREHIRRALELNIQRRREERERRRKEYLSNTTVRLPWDKKAPELPFRKSAGAAMYPIKMELRSPSPPSAAMATQPRSKADAAVGADIDISDDQEWKPVAAMAPAPPLGPGPAPSVPVSAGPSLEDQRKAWMEKSLKSTTVRKGESPKSTKKFSMKKSTMLAGPASSPGATGGPPALRPVDDRTLLAGPPEIYGSQPAMLQMDEDAVKEIHAHSMGQMMQNILTEATRQQAKSKSKATPKKAAVRKDPKDMTPEELIELRRRDPRAWDEITKTNTVYSYAISTPNVDDMQRGRKTMKSKKTNRVTFEQEVDVARVPVGRDFRSNEKTDRSKAVLRQ